MIQLTAEIQVFSQSNGVIESVSSNTSGNNVSCDISETINKHDSVGGNPFLLGISKFGDGSVFTADRVDYFIGREVSGVLGYFDTPYTITLRGSDIKSVTIVFDTVNGGYPKSMSVDGTYFTDDDATFTISDTTVFDFWRDDITEHTIVIYSWNKPNRPLIIQGIYTTPTILKIDRRNLISLDSNIVDRSDISLPSWGVISNRGSITFNDISGEVLDYAENGLLSEGQEVNIYLEDTLSTLLNKKTKVGNFITSKWNYDNDSKVASVSLTDGLETLQNLPTSVLRSPLYVTDDFYSILHGLEMSVKNEYLFMYDISISDLLTNTKYSEIMIGEGSVWGHLNKVCEALGCYAYSSPRNRKWIIISKDFRG